MKYIYGPVRSRRLGLSLGLSITPYKTCSFDCLYCQLGKTTDLASEVKEYVPVEEIMAELNAWVENNGTELAQLNYITFSGSGEPTLNAGLFALIAQIKKAFRCP